MNPYEPSPQKVASLESDTDSTRSVVQAVARGFIHSLTGLFLLLLVCLPIRYPGLSDQQAGQAHYWPEDLFNLLLPVAGVFLVVSVLLWLGRYFTLNPKPNDLDAKAN